MATTREQLRQLIDTLPDDRLDEARAALTMLNVPDDDEPTTAEDLAAIASGREAYQRGELIPHEELKREMGWT
jgi:predicted transcriptional regulator